MRQRGRTIGFYLQWWIAPDAAGSHRLTLTAFVDLGTRLESQRSAPLEVVMGGRIVVASTPGVSIVTTVDGVHCVPAPLLTAWRSQQPWRSRPTVSIFIAERAGRIRVVRNRLQPASRSSPMSSAPLRTACWRSRSILASNETAGSICGLYSGVWLPHCALPFCRRHARRGNDSPGRYRILFRKAGNLAAFRSRCQAVRGFR